MLRYVQRTKVLHRKSEYTIRKLPEVYSTTARDQLHHGTNGLYAHQVCLHVPVHTQGKGKVDILVQCGHEPMSTP
jgi:hypothetical protein